MASGILSALEEALAEWSTLLGEENVVMDLPSLRAAATTTFATRQTVAGIIRPASSVEVQECMRIANRFRVAVYPVSSGKNWGYGSRVPVADSSIILDLSRMNRILDFSEELAYVTLEPGVTQEQLYAFLVERGSRLWMDATGSSPECSMIGNTMERGFGHTPYGDHFANVCGFEVVLPTGERIETGYGRFAGAKATPVYRWGVGPVVDGLFTQSNMGIVTRLTMWLMPAPECFEALYFRCDKEDGLPDLIDALRPLRLNGTLRSSIHIGNDYKIVNALRQYPWEEMNGQTPLRGPVLDELRKRLNIGYWNGAGGLYGTRKQVAEARRLVSKALKGKVSKLQFLDDQKIRIAGRFSGVYRLVTGWDLAHTLEVLKPVYGLMKGIPTAKPMESVYWRKKTPAPAQPDPDRDGCGLLWFSPISPARGQDVDRLASLGSSVLLDFGFEPMISLTLIGDRTVACVISIAYDRDVPDEDARAAGCYSALQRSLSEEGYQPYRLGIQSMDGLRSEDGYSQVLRTIKNALDPHNVMAPGRYLAAKARV